MSWFEKLIVRFLAWLLPHRDIAKNGNLYLRRHYLTPRSWKWRVFLHLILRPDNDRNPHSHPWPWFGKILKGGYTEEVFDRGTFLFRRTRRPGWFSYRPAEFTHQIVEVPTPTWTLVIAGQAHQVWGFYEPDGTFIPWNEYLEREDGAVPEALPEDKF